MRRSTWKKVRPLETLELIRSEVSTSWAWLEQVVGDVTTEQANWWPPGTANSIATTYLHVVINADVEGVGMLFGLQPGVVSFPVIGIGPFLAGQSFVPGATEVRCCALRLHGKNLSPIDRVLAVRYETGVLRVSLNETAPR